MATATNGLSVGSEARDGWYTFAGFMFLIAAVANGLWAWAAFDKAAYLPEGSLLVSNLSFWGWVSVVAAVVALIGSGMLLVRARGAAVYGCVVAALSAVFWLFALPLLPIWSLLIIGIDALIIYGLATSSEAEPAGGHQRAGGDGEAASAAAARTAVEGSKKQQPVG